VVLSEQCNRGVWFSLAMGISSYSVGCPSAHKLVSSIRVAVDSKWQHQGCSRLQMAENCRQFCKMNRNQDGSQANHDGPIECDGNDHSSSDESTSKKCHSSSFKLNFSTWRSVNCRVCILVS